MASSSQIAISDFSYNILDKVIHFKVIKLDGSLFVWVGSRPVLTNMGVAMPAKYDNLPTSTALFGREMENTSETLAKKLAKKMNKQVFVSCSIPFDQQLSLLIEQKLGLELSKVDGQTSSKPQRD